MSPLGLEFDHHGLRERHRIPWSDIESIGVLPVQMQKFTAVRLKSYRGLLEGISAEEAMAFMRSFRLLRMVSYGVIATGATNLRPTGLLDIVSKGGDLLDLHELADAWEGSAEVRNLAGALNWSRTKYGAEILLGWTHRDRSAEALAHLLDQYRQRYG